MLQDCIKNNFLKYVHHSYTYLSIYTNKKKYSTCFYRIYIYFKLNMKVQTMKN